MGGSLGLVASNWDLGCRGLGLRGLKYRSVGFMVLGARPWSLGLSNYRLGRFRRGVGV